MPDFASMLPDSDALMEGLAAAFHDNGRDARSLTLLRRLPTPYAMTFPCEIVTCRIGRGKPRRLFCKYSSNIDYTGHGHRGGVEYESAVYRNILRAPSFRPRFYGAYRDPRTGQHWIFLEYLDNSLRVGKVNDTGVMIRAARWIARFQVAADRLLARGRGRFLKKYDRDYYLGWVRRTSEFAGSHRDRFPWLDRLCARAGGLLAPLLALRPTIIHGEYYQNNILLHRGQVRPIDWESAAVAEGVIDLAALTTGWGPRITKACTESYVATRWPGGAPAGFRRIVTAAELYLNFRWLGDNPEATRSMRFRECWVRLQSLAREAESDHG